MLGLHSRLPAATDSTMVKRRRQPRRRQPRRRMASLELPAEEDDAYSYACARPLQDLRGQPAAPKHLNG